MSDFWRCFEVKRSLLFFFAIFRLLTSQHRQKSLTTDSRGVASTCGGSDCVKLEKGGVGPFGEFETDPRWTPDGKGQLNFGFLKKGGVPTPPTPTASGETTRMR